MSTKPDDFDVAKTIVEALEPFEKQEKEKIIRWVCERLEIAQQPVGQIPSQQEIRFQQTQNPTSHGQGKDIKVFLSEKAPKSDNQFAAAVAYYYMFEAPSNEKKTSIKADDLQNACRLGGVSRLKRPDQTLINAHNVGVLDKAVEKGSYSINAVGENLVAMTMPSSTGVVSAKSKKRTSKSKAKKKQA